VFACVTFPFLFGVMFGDIGHGAFLAFIGLVLVLGNDCLLRWSPAMAPALALRYLVLLMGLFATFCGLIYNDFMAIPIWGFGGSCYEMGVDASGKEQAILKPDCVYPIGIDPIWYLAKNELAFMNSLKMKLSVILGVLQMSLGICMKAANAIHFGNKLDLWLEFLPQIILLWCLFGYMDLLIVAKWLTDFTGREYQAPSVISSMIGMALNGGALEKGQVAVIGSNEG
jgi:V-type H+-transporting ATPase subunit a